MAWVKLDDQARHHRKVLAAGPVGAWLWVCGLMYCNSQKARDGFIPESVLAVLYPIRGVKREALRLVSVGLWTRTSEGYVVHDYHDYQPTPEAAAATSEARSLAGKLGGVRSGESRRSNGATKPEANAKQVASSKTKPVPSRPDPVPIPREKTESAVAPKPPRAEKIRKTGTRLPDTWTVSETLAAWTRTQGISDRDVAATVEHFKDHWLAADHRNAVKADWDAAFRTWVRRDIEAGKIVPYVRPVQVEFAKPTAEQVEAKRESQALVASAIAEMDARMAGGA